MSHNKTEPKERDPFSERPPNSDFQQQNLKAWQPLLTPFWVIGTFFILGAMFIPIGFFILGESNKVIEVESDDYSTFPLNTTVSLNLIEAIPANTTVFFYYKLTNYYQNHRRYVKSRSDAQLRGDVTATKGSSALDKCDPLVSNTELNLPYYPCGLIAASFFDDEFEPPQGVHWTENGTAWPTDKDNKFIYSPALAASATNTSAFNKTLPAVNSEPFMVWMRTAGLPDFKKLRYKFVTDQIFAKNTTLTFTVKNQYNVTSFGGTKHIVISTTSILGGKNEFLAYAYLIVGGICILLSILFFLKHMISPRPLGDMRYFNFPHSKE